LLYLKLEQNSNKIGHGIERSFKGEKEIYSSFFASEHPLEACGYLNMLVQGLIIKGTTTTCLRDAHKKATAQAGGWSLWGHAAFAGVSPPPGRPHYLAKHFPTSLCQGKSYLAICSRWLTSALAWEVVSVPVIRLILKEDAEVFT